MVPSTSGDRALTPGTPALSAPGPGSFFFFSIMSALTFLGRPNPSILSRGRGRVIPSLPLAPGLGTKPGLNNQIIVLFVKLTA